MPTKPTVTQELDVVDPKAEWHAWSYEESEGGMIYAHEFGQAITQRDASDRIAKLHGLISLPEGAKVWHEEATEPTPEVQENAPIPSPVPEPAPIPDDPENPVG